MGMSRRSVGCFSRCERRATAYLTWRKFFVLACIAWGKEHRGQLLSLAPGAHFYPRQSFMKMSAPSRLFAGRNAAILWERTTPDRDFVVHSLTGILEKQNPLNMPRIHHQGVRFCTTLEARPPRPTGAALNATLIPLHFAGLRRGLASIMSKNLL